MTQAPKVKLYNMNNGKITTLVEMPSLMKKKHVIGVLKKGTMILFPNMKNKNKQREAYKRLVLHFYHHLHQLMKFQQHDPYWKEVKGHHVLEVYKRFMR